MTSREHAIWTPLAFLRACRRTFERPSDFVLALRVGWFLWVLPRRVARESVPVLLESLGSLSPRTPVSLWPRVARIARVRQAWLNRLAFGSRNTCYARAITMFHFLGARGDVCFHLGVEREVGGGDRLHGHAWVTYRGELLEGPESVTAGRVEELYVFPS